MRLAYLQFDGVTNLANSHRKVGNLFDVKLRAIENLHAAGIDVVLVVTVVGGVNDAQVGPIIDFAVANADKITVVSFQPVSFTGRDEDVADDVRATQRYTLSHLAHDVKKQTGATEPLRDWFPLSALGPFSDLTDTLMGERSDWGALKCGCHPNCGIGTVLFVHKKTKRMVPLTEFLDLEQLLHDVQDITDGAQARGVSLLQLAVALAKNFDAAKAPPGFTIYHLLRQFLSQTGNRGTKVGEFDGDAGEFEWRALFVAGMWFQDLYNYDFRRTEMCIIPYGTQMGEISFCAYNTGVGWRNIIEKMKANATVGEWYRDEGPARRLREEPGPPAPGRAGHDRRCPRRRSACRSGMTWRSCTACPRRGGSRSSGEAARPAPSVARDPHLHRVDRQHAPLEHVHPQHAVARAARRAAGRRVLDERDVEPNRELSGLHRRVA